MTWQYQNEQKWINYDTKINDKIEECYLSKKLKYNFSIKQDLLFTEHSIIFSTNCQILVGNCIIGTNCNKCKLPGGKHFRNVRRLAECCICFEKVTDTDYLLCDNNHIICGKDCINGLVESQLEQISNRINNGNKIDVIKCPSCDFMYKTQTLLPKLNDDIYNKLMLVRDSSVGALAQKEISTTKNNKDRNVIINDILTLKCPHCNNSFYDWDLHCLSFECSNCHLRFCGACLTPFYNNDHGYEHILNECEYNPNGKNGVSKSIFLTRGNELDEFNKLHCKRKTHLIRNYLNNFSLIEKNNIIESLSTELRDLGIDNNF